MFIKMKTLKKIYDYIFNSDYAIKDTKKAIKLRIQISNCKNNPFSKIIKKLKEKKYKKICYRNNAFIPIDTKFIEEGNVCFPHGLSGIFISGGGYYW